MNNVNCHRDMTEILLKAAENTIQSINPYEGRENMFWISFNSLPHNPEFR